MFEKGKRDLFAFIKNNNASHYHRLMNFGLEKDIRYCLTADVANVLPLYNDGKLISKSPPVEARTTGQTAQDS
jgi:2-phosphosulfolactate phosphatase